MSIATSIESIVNSLYPDATYALSSEFRANVKSYNLSEITTTKPLIILNNEQPREKEIQVNANVLSNTRILMYFLTKSDIYTNDNDLNTALDDLEIIADRVMLNIYQLDDVRLKNNELQQYRLTPRFRVWSSILSGWEAEARFKENQIRNWCNV